MVYTIPKELTYQGSTDTRHPRSCTAWVSHSHVLPQVIGAVMTHFTETNGPITIITRRCLLTFNTRPKY